MITHYEIIGHCNIALSMILESIYQKYQLLISQKAKVDIICRYKDNFDIHYGNQYKLISQEPINIEEFPIEEWVPEREQNKLIAHMDIKDRIEVYDYLMEEFKLECYNYTNLIDPSAQNASTSRIGYGCYICAGNIIAPYAEIGNFTFLNRSVSIGHHTKIGEFCNINPGCNIGGDCIVGKQTTIGIGATILDGIIVGENAFVGAGSVVTKNVQPNTIVYGVPAKFIREKK